MFLSLIAMDGWLFRRGWSLGFLGFCLESDLDCSRAIGGSLWNDYKKWTRQQAQWQLPSMMISLQVRTAANPRREMILAPWVEFHALLQTFLFALGTRRHSSFKYKRSVRNYCKPAWHLQVDAPARCHLPLLGASHQRAVLEWTLWLQADLACGLWI